MLYAGVATFRGTGCTSTNPAYDFSKLPTQVRFRFGFQTPTSYRNCQNPDNAPAQPFSGEEQQRGVQIKANTTVFAQATLHTDHVFWVGCSTTRRPTSTLSPPAPRRMAAELTS